MLPEDSTSRHIDGLSALVVPTGRTFSLSCLGRRSVFPAWQLHDRRSTTRQNQTSGECGSMSLGEPSRSTGLSFPLVRHIVQLAMGSYNLTSPICNSLASDLAVRKMRTDMMLLRWQALHSRFHSLQHEEDRGR